VLSRDANFLEAFGLGVVGSLPLLFLSQKIERSESPLVGTLNLSTEITMLRIFGSEPRPTLALAVSLFLACLTGLVEEVTFRGEALPVLAQWSVDHLGVGNGIPWGTALSTLLFAALHVNPKGLFGGRDAAVDALVLFALQICTGGTFALLFLVTHNLAVPIVAHSIYDFYTFYKTHLEVTTQMEYASTLRPRGEVGKKWKTERGEEFVREAGETFYLMDKNQDGVVSRKELRVALFSYGVNLSKMESLEVLKAADADESGEIDFNEFLEFIDGGSPNKAVQGALLGARL